VEGQGRAGKSHAETGKEKSGYPRTEAAEGRKDQADVAAKKIERKRCHEGGQLATRVESAGKPAKGKRKGGARECPREPGRGKKERNKAKKSMARGKKGPLREQGAGRGPGLAKREGESAQGAQPRR